MSLPFLAACQAAGTIESGPAEVEIVESTGGQADDGSDVLGSTSASSASEQDQNQSSAITDGATSGSSADADQTGDPSAPVEVEASTNDVVLASATAEMSGNPRRPESGWGILTVDRAYSTVDFEGNDATDGRKWVAVEFQLLGGELGTLWQSAFRLQADGEWYSPANEFSEQYEIGEVVNGTVIFVVPLSASDFVLEGGSTDGRLAAYALTVE